VYHHHGFRLEAAEPITIDVDAFRAPCGPPAKKAKTPPRIDPERIAHVTAFNRPGPNARGSVSLMRLQMSKVTGKVMWNTVAVPINELATSPHLQWCTHLTPNNFNGTRRSDRVVQINEVFVDLDFHTRERVAHLRPEDVAAMALARAKERGLPLPSGITFSGRGVLLRYAFHPMPGTAAPRVKALQNALHGVSDLAHAPPELRRDKHALGVMLRNGSVWRGLGLDRRAKDLSRVFRICGSKNEKSGQVVRLIWPARWEDVRIYDFEELCAAFLPYTREEIEQKRADRAERAAARDAVRKDRQDRRRDEKERYALEDKEKPRRFNSRWTAQLALLHDVRDKIWGGHVPVGFRDLWAYHVAVCWAQMGEGDLRSWAKKLAPLVGLSEHELRGALGTVYGRMQAALRGEKNSQGKDLRYAPRRHTLLQDLEITMADAARVGVALTARTAKQRQAECRRRKGVKPATDKNDARLLLGMNVLHRRARGETWAKISQVLGPTIPTLRAAAKLAEAHSFKAPAQAVICAPKTASKPGMTLRSTGKITSHCLKVVKPYRAAPALPRDGEITSVRRTAAVGPPTRPAEPPDIGSMSIPIRVPTAPPPPSSTTGWPQSASPRRLTFAQAWQLEEWRERAERRKREGLDRPVIPRTLEPFRSGA
jgi:hypothetical protein